MIKAIRLRMKKAATQTADAAQSACSQAAAAELARLIDRHSRGLIGDEEFAARKAVLERET
jgi:hypothetical protein